MSRQINALLAIRGGMTMREAARRHRVKVGQLHFLVYQRFSGVADVRSVPLDELYQTHAKANREARKCIHCRRKFFDHDNMRLCIPCRGRVEEMSRGYV